LKSKSKPKNVLKLLRSEVGSTLIESMIAFSIFAVSAMAIYPILIFTKTINRGNDVRELCMQAVKTKLAQYTSGGKLSNFDSSKFGSLSSPLGASSGEAGSFQYAKLRYNMLFRDGICDGQAQANILRSSSSGARSLGLRECLGSEDVAAARPSGNTCLNEASGDFDGPCSSSYATDLSAFPSPTAYQSDSSWEPDQFHLNKCSANDLDVKVRAQLPYFKLYVKIQRITPWSLNASALRSLQGPGGLNDFRFDPSCPNSRSGPFLAAATDTDASIYDFDSLGDSIRVTVTGVIDLSASTANPIKSLGGITTTDPSRLMCSVSTVLTQDEPPVRYALIGDGMYAMRASGFSGFDPASASTSGGQLEVMGDSMSAAIDGAKAFVVHPLNLSVYLLGGGSLRRYSQCGGIPLTCHIGTDDYTGASWTMLKDDGSLIAPSAAGALYGVQSYAIPGGNTYQHVFMDMRSGDTPRVYLGSQNVCSIVRPVGQADPEEPLPDEGGDAEVLPVSDSSAVDSRVATAFSDYWNTTYCTGDASANSVGAVQSAIFDPAGTEGFIMGLSQQGLGLFRAKDWQRNNPIMRLQPSYRALSK